MIENLGVGGYYNTFIPLECMCIVQHQDQGTQEQEFHLIPWLLWSHHCSWSHHCVTVITSCTLATPGPVTCSWLVTGHSALGGVIMAGTCMQTLCGKWPKLNKYLMRSRILTLLILLISRLKCNVNSGFLHLEHIFSPHPQSQSLNHHPSGQLLSFLVGVYPLTAHIRHIS